MTIYTIGHSTRTLDEFLGLLRAQRIEAGAAGIAALAESMTTAVLCAERHPLRCHRQLISDYVTSQGHEVNPSTPRHECRHSWKP
jgi:uncharacterized protein (DUF488 family)